MLKSDFGKVTIQGIKPLIIAELASLIYALRNNSNLTDKDIKEAINDGFKSQKEIDKIGKKIINKKRSTKEVQDLIRKIANARKSGLVKDEEKSDIQIHHIRMEDLDKETQDSLKDILGKIMGE